MRWHFFVKVTGMFMLALSTSFTHAVCRINPTILTMSENQQVTIPFGQISLTDPYLQAPGTLLASAVVPPTNYTSNGANANSVLWTCDASDRGSLLFQIAVNGRDRVGGAHNMSQFAGGQTGVFATHFQYVGLRLTMGGQVVDRTWKSISVKNYETVGNKINIRLGDIPPLQAELIRISASPIDSVTTCSSLGLKGLALSTSNVTSYRCWSPNAIIQLYGGGLISDPFGSDSAFNMVGPAANNGLPFGMLNGSTMTSQKTCRVTSSANSVTFNAISMGELERGESRQENFSVQLECSTGTPSGVDQGQTAIGIQTSEGAFAAATQLGLVAGTGAVSYLVSDDYLTNPNLAKGVGIALSNANTGKKMLFLGQNLNAGGSAKFDTGWYPALEGAASMGGSGMPGFELYNQSFTATLSKIPGEKVTAGKVQATAYVQVRVQ